VNSRRTFLKLLAGAMCVPVLPARASGAPLLVGDGLHDDTAALNALLRGDVIETALDMTGCGWVGDTLHFPKAEYFVSGPVEIPDAGRPVIVNGGGCVLRFAPNVTQSIVIKRGATVDTLMNFIVIHEKDGSREG
jgi:hypothetical protein